MLNSIIVVLKHCTGIKRWININALHLARKFRLQRFERQQVVALDEPVIENILVRHPLLGVVAAIRFFLQDARLQPRPLVFADPS